MFEFQKAERLLKKIIHGIFYFFVSTISYNLSIVSGLYLETVTFKNLKTPKAINEILREFKGI